MLIDVLDRLRRAIARRVAAFLLPEAKELALATVNADFTAPGCEDVLKKMARALLETTGE